MPIQTTRIGPALPLGGLTLRQLVRRIWSKTSENEIVHRAAAIAFYAMLALVPFLAVLLTLAIDLLPDLSGSSDQRGMVNLTVAEFDATLREVFPPDIFELVRTQIVWVQQHPPVGLVSIGLALSLVLSSSLFVGISDALNVIYHVKETRPFWKLRLVAAFTTLLQAIILLGALVVMVAWPLVADRLRLSPQTAFGAMVVQWFVVAAALLLSFEVALYLGPNTKRRWQWITPGGLLGCVVLMGATWLFGLYVQMSGSYDRTYGSLGGVMALLVWFWVCAVVLLFAAQLNQVIEDARARASSPEDGHAVTGSD